MTSSPYSSSLAGGATFAGDIPTANQISMEGKTAVDADKEQALGRSVGLFSMTTARAHLRRIVCVYFDGHRAVQNCLVAHKGLQFGKGPLRLFPIGPSLLLTGFLAVSAIGAISNIHEVFQSNQRPGKSDDDLFGSGMVQRLFVPSLSSAYRAKSACHRTSAEPLFLFGFLPGLQRATSLLVPTCLVHASYRRRSGCCLWCQW